MPVEEYLHTSFPGVDCEYRDGEIVERALPDTFHGQTQAQLGFCFHSLRKQLPIFAAHSVRLKLREGLYLIPDVSVFWPARPAPLPDSPPLIAAEVLAPNDRFIAVREKLREYHDWGVGHVWLVDPHSRRLYTCDTGLTEVTTFFVSELNLTLGPDQIFD
jgi:Uma2 family endonuclease